MAPATKSEYRAEIVAGTEVLINSPGHWAHGHRGIVSRRGYFTARVQLSTREGCVTIRLTKLEA
ncbi:hypothetical protein MycrhDRAFT_5744 [Mycolicibacterium rhodesiae JS60]|nr:hypothetical protein MycrhDRAFT_5744 [Mycolicibacterium rhodesiae JS60]